tara:strand:+ start:440 stop:658 length:219 start_codon:yes stop_codon:yes gene_type:complete
VLDVHSSHTNLINIKELIQMMFLITEDTQAVERDKREFVANNIELAELDAFDGEDAQPLDINVQPETAVKHG